MAASTGKPVDKIMASFITQPGLPMVAVHADCAGGATSLTLSQSRFHLAGASTTPELWTIPVCFRDVGGTGATSCELLSRASQKFTLPGCAARVANARGTGYYRTAYDAKTLGAIESRIDALSEPERLQLESDTWSLVRNGADDVGAYLGVSAALSSDRGPDVIGDVSGKLRFLGDDLTTDASRAPYQAWIVRTFGPAFDKLGWTSAAGEPAEEEQVRASLASLVAGAGHDAAALDKARALVMAELKAPGTLNATMAARLVPLVAEHGNAALYDAYLARRDKAITPEDRDRFLHALGLFTDPALVKRTVDLALLTHVRTQDTALLLGNALAGPVGYTEVWPLVRDRWNEVVNHIDPAFGMVNVVGPLGSFCDAQAATDLQKFFTTHTAHGGQRTVQQSIEEVRACGALKDAQAPKLAAWLQASGSGSK